MNSNTSSQVSVSIEDTAMDGRCVCLHPVVRYLDARYGREGTRTTIAETGMDLGYLDNMDQDFNPFRFDAKTDLAVRFFEEQNGLAVDGIVDFNFWQALYHPATQLPQIQALYRG